MTKQFYIRLSDIIKKALEAAYGIQTLEKTTSEIYEALSAQSESAPGSPEAGALTDIETLLLSCDMVKFARYIPSPPEIEEVLQKAFQILAGCRARRQSAQNRTEPLAEVS